MNEQLLAEIEPVVAEFHLDLDELRLTQAGKRRVLEVVVDGDSPVDLDAIAAVSRAISDHLDGTNIMGQMPYVLEVSSRGVGRPLTKPAHWRRNIGRLVHAIGADFDITGRISAFDDPTVVIDVQGQERSLNIDTVSRALIEVEFNRRNDQVDDIDEIEDIETDGQDD